MIRWFYRHCRSLFVLIATTWLVGCVRMEPGKPPGPWYEAYEPIEDPATEAFLFQSLEKAIALFGEPVVPVNQVIFRRSRKVVSVQNYRIGEDFSMTECIDSTNGIFVIYLGVDPDHQNYYPLLGHECAHLINAKITDWYMEGIATVFSESICEQAGKPWGDWSRHFMHSRKDPYGLSYRMMRDLQSEFPERYRGMVQFVVGNGSGWQHIAIDAWLDTLSLEEQARALGIIQPHVKVLRHRVSEQYGFAVPAALR